jgi:beta-mannosidase
MVERGTLLQCEGYKCIFEEARRQKPVCSMALNWCFNEPWPTAANNSLISWPHAPKPAYFAVRASCRPLLASARISRFRWHEGEIFDPELWILNDLQEAVQAGTIEACLQLGDKAVLLLRWDHPEIPAGENLPGPVIIFRLPGSEPGRMTLKLKSVGRPELDSEYTLVFSR